MPGDQSSLTATANATAAIKAYALPLIMFSLFLFFQLIVLPHSFPPSHYDVLGIKRYSSVEDVKIAYQKISSSWDSGEGEVPSAVAFIKIQYAYELVTHPTWKRDYDIFGIDEQLHVFDKLKEEYAGKSYTDVVLPLLDASPLDIGDHIFNSIKTEDFGSFLNGSKPRLLQIYSLGSNRCTKFSKMWKRIAALLDGVADTGMVELREVQLAMLLAEREPSGQFFFRNGLPSLIAFPPECRRLDCIVRYDGDLSVDAVTDWFATNVLGLPRILYHLKESLGQNFLAKSGPHKVKVIFFSSTGERATPFVRQVARNYWGYASFAFVLWRQEDFSVWWNAFGVESAPAIVFVKDPGVKPVVFHGSFNNTWFLDVMDRNKNHELPQLRSTTSMDLGCDARGYSRAGNDTTSWYCVILAGRLSLELNKMRETMRRVQEQLSHDGELSTQSLIVASSLQNKRLTFAWLDGEAQQKYCLFYLHSESAFETCGTRRDMSDVPRIFLVRYKRNATLENVEVPKKRPNPWSLLEDNEVDPASQLVARYNGSDDKEQIIRWISDTIRDGESRDLPFYRAKTPDLVPEDSEPIWSRGAQSIVSKSMGFKQKMHNTVSNIYDHLGDPRIGPMLLLGALISSGTIWLRRSQPNRPSPSNQSSQPTPEEESRPKRRKRARTMSGKDVPPSITDEEPKGAYQLLSDSDSE